jgi:hypothetical protein
MQTASIKVYHIFCGEVFQFAVVAKSALPMIERSGFYPIEQTSNGG